MSDWFGRKTKPSSDQQTPRNNPHVPRPPPEPPDDEEEETARAEATHPGTDRLGHHRTTDNGNSEPPFPVPMIDQHALEQHLLNPPQIQEPLKSSTSNEIPDRAALEAELSLEEILQDTNLTKYADLLSHLKVTNESAMSDLIARLQSVPDGQKQAESLGAMPDLYHQFVKDIRVRSHVLLIASHDEDPQAAQVFRTNCEHLQIMYEDTRIFPERPKVHFVLATNANDVRDGLKKFITIGRVLRCLRLVLHYSGRCKNGKLIFPNAMIVNDRELEPKEFSQWMTMIRIPEKILFFDMCDAAPMVNALHRETTSSLALAVMAASETPQAGPVTADFTSLLIAGLTLSSRCPSTDSTKCIVQPDACSILRLTAEICEGIPADILHRYICQHIQAAGLPTATLNVSDIYTMLLRDFRSEDEALPNAHTCPLIADDVQSPVDIHESNVAVPWSNVIQLAQRNMLSELHIDNTQRPFATGELCACVGLRALADASLSKPLKIQSISLLSCFDHRCTCEIRKPDINDVDSPPTTSNAQRGHYWEGFVRALSSGSFQISKLDLSGNHLNDGDIGMLARAIKNNVTLTKLILDDNNFTDEGVRLLTEALKVNTTLSKISLKSDKKLPIQLYIWVVFVLIRCKCSRCKDQPLKIGMINTSHSPDSAVERNSICKALEQRLISVFPIVQLSRGHASFRFLDMPITDEFEILTLMNQPVQAPTREDPRLQLFLTSLDEPSLHEWQVIHSTFGKAIIGLVGVNLRGITIAFEKFDILKQWLQPTDSRTGVLTLNLSEMRIDKTFINGLRAVLSVCTRPLFLKMDHCDCDLNTFGVLCDVFRDVPCDTLDSLSLEGIVPITCNPDLFDQYEDHTVRLCAWLHQKLHFRGLWLKENRFDSRRFESRILNQISTSFRRNPWTITYHRYHREDSGLDVRSFRVSSETQLAK